MKIFPKYLISIVATLCLLFLVAFILEAQDIIDIPLATNDTSVSSPSDAFGLHNQALKIYGDSLSKSTQEQKEVLYEAIALMTQALDQDPEYSSALVNRGNFYAGLDEIELALADYDKAIALGNSVVAYRNKATVLEQQGDLENSLDNYEKALRLYGVSDEMVSAASIDSTDKPKDTDGTLLIEIPSVKTTVEKVQQLRKEIGKS